jgi:hypothetical protein
MPLLEIDIEARYARFRDAMTQIERQTQSSAAKMSKAFETVKGTLAGLGVAVSAGALVSVVKNAIDAADHLNDLSKQTGVAVDTLGGLGFAAGQAGGDLESIAAAAGKLNKSIAEAAGGNKEFGDAFKAMGIDIRDVEGKLKTADQVLIELANKFATYADGPEKVAIAVRLLGKAGAEQIALLNDGGQALQENIEYYKRYAGVTQETANQADAFNDTLGKLHLLSGAFGRTLAAELLPTLESVSGALLASKENGTQFNEWAERAAGAVKILALGGVAAASVLDNIAIKAVLAGSVMKDLATLRPGEIAKDWEKYSQSVDKSANSFHDLYKSIRNPPDADKYEEVFNGNEKLIKEEQDLFATRKSFLQKYRNEDLISEKDYQTKKAAAQKELVEKTKKYIGTQIENLTEKKKVAETPEEAKRIQARIDELYKKKELVGVEKSRAPVLPSATKAPLAKVPEKLADAENRNLERLSDREREILADRTEFLTAYYQEDLISITDYYAGRRAAQDEALREQEANITKEIDNLQRLKPKDALQKVEIDSKVDALVDKRKAIQEAAGKASIQLSIEETRAAKAFEDTLAGINAELLEQQGLLSQAAGVRFDLSNDKIKTKLQTERDSAVSRGDAATAAARGADLERLAALRNMAISKAKLNSLDEIGEQIQFKLTEATERAAMSAQTGAVTELESLRAVSDARLQAVADLQQVADAFDAIARSSGDQRMTQEARALQLRVDSLAASADLVREKFENAFSGPFESALEKMISGTASFRDVIKGLAGDISAEFSKIAAQNLTKQMLGKDGLFGGAVDFVSGVFGGKSKAPAASSDVAGALVKATGGATDAAAAASASAALTTLVTSATAADTALLTMGTTIPVANGALTAMGATTLTADGALVSLAASASVAATALAAVAASSGSEVASSAAYAAFDFLASAKGNIFAGGNVVPFAKGGIPDIVSVPTHFPMKDGRLGLMGEAGPEAIMPLARDKGGELAVRMVGNRGEVDLLPVTRDGSGRMAVRAPVKAFANGGVFGATEPTRLVGTSSIREQASTLPARARAETVAVPIGQFGSSDPSVSTKGGDTHVHVSVAPPAGASRASASQWGAEAGRQIQKSLRRNT